MPKNVFLDDLLKTDLINSSIDHLRGQTHAARVVPAQRRREVALLRALGQLDGDGGGRSALGTHLKRTHKISDRIPKNVLGVKSCLTGL